MKPYIPKQAKYVRERIEAKLDERLVRTLERYCEYLESDRDYVLTQALELVFRKDKNFADWLALRQEQATAEPPMEAPKASRALKRKSRPDGTAAASGANDAFRPEAEGAIAQQKQTL
jgi:hypothetical protein